MKKCPYCFEDVEPPVKRCPHCHQFVIDPLIEISYPAFEKKKCIYCGKKVRKEARFCKHCQKWLDSVDRAADDYDKM